MGTLTSKDEWSVFLKSFQQTLELSEWPGQAGASEEVLASAEARLKIKLPPSYRSFLSTSNGWTNASRAVPILRPAQKIRWFGREHKDWVQAYLEPLAGLEPPLPPDEVYFSYTEEGSGHFDASHLKHALCISEIGDDAVLLLNPMVIWPDGEWEAWLFANWIPGATRYRSFAEWMRSEAAKAAGDTYQYSGVSGELPTVYKDGPTKAQRRIRPPEKLFTLDELSKKLASSKASHRIKAVKGLCRLGGGEAIALLINGLKDVDGHVRAEAADALAKLRATSAIDALIEITDDDFMGSSAIHALAAFNDEKSAQHLLNILESGGIDSGVAVYPLATRRDVRALPFLIAMLENKIVSMHGATAGRDIAMFEEAGFNALLPLTNHIDAEISRRAIMGIGDVACLAKDKTLRNRAKEFLKSLLPNETDQEFRRSLQFWIDY